MTDLDDLSKRMHASVEHLRSELSGLRGGRATPALVEPIQVPVYGSRMPISQLANVSVPESRMIVIAVWDASVVSAIERAIMEANLGLTPQTEGVTIRLRLPEMTEERRKELLKVAASYGEAAKVSVRNLRRSANEDVKKQEKDGDIGKDEAYRAQEQIQKLTETVVTTIDNVLESHSKDLLKL